MSNLVNLPIAKVSDVPEHLRTFLKLQDDGTLPTVPMATINEIKEQSKKALFRYISTPGLVRQPLTNEEKEKYDLSSIEIWAYNQAIKIQDIDCDFNTSKYIADLVIGPPVQKSERVEVTGNIQEWQDRITVAVKEMAPQLEEAIRHEKDKHERASAAS